MVLPGNGSGGAPAKKKKSVTAVGHLSVTGAGKMGTAVGHIKPERANNAPATPLSMLNPLRIQDPIASIRNMIEGKAVPARKYADDQRTAPVKKVKDRTGISASAADNDTPKKSKANRDAKAKYVRDNPQGGGSGGGLGGDLGGGTGGYVSNPSVAAAIAAIGKVGKGAATKGSTSSGNLQDYISKYRSMMPTVDYGSLIDNANDQAGAGDKKIQGVYNGLSAYIGGLGGSLAKDAGDNANLRTQGAQSAVQLLNGAYDASRASVSEQLNNIGGMQGINPDPAGTSAAHQQAAAGDISSRLASSLDANARDLSSRQAFNDMAGASAQMQGAEQRSQLQASLAKMVAQYRTQQSQENASNAMQALSMGTSQFNTDRSFAQSERAAAQDALNQEYARRVAAANLAISQDNTAYSRYRDTVGDQRSAASAQASAVAQAAKDAQKQANWQSEFDQRADLANASNALKTKPVSSGPSQAQSNIYLQIIRQFPNDPAKQQTALAAAKKAGYL